jgi:hypothetical protein
MGCDMYWIKVLSGWDPREGFINAGKHVDSRVTGNFLTS